MMNNVAYLLIVVQTGNGKERKMIRYYLRGCTMEYQLQNVINPKYRAINKVKTIADGEIQIIEVEMVSENGTSWYPLSTLTTELSI